MNASQAFAEFWPRVELWRSAELWSSLPYFIAAIGPAYIVAVAWPLARIDIRERRLPNRLVLPAFPAAITAQFLASWLIGDWWPMAVSVVCALVALGLGMAVNRTDGLGMGDVKLISAMVLALGWFSPLAPLVALVMSFALASAWLLMQLIRRKTNMGSSIALGPYLLVGFTAVSIGQVWS
jgi:leader peptidase (prepilin peptidase)/N-methyltransferase